MFRIGHRFGPGSRYRPGEFTIGGDPFGFGTTFSTPFRSGSFAPERALSPLTEPSADVEFVVRRREAQPARTEEATGNDAFSAGAGSRWRRNGHGS